MYNGYGQKKSIPKPVIFGAIAVVLLIVIAVVAVLVLPRVFSNVQDGSNLTDKDFEADLDAYNDAVNMKEKLNSSYAAEAAKDSHADYHSKNSYSSLIASTPADICKRLVVKCSQLSEPSNVVAFNSISALNANSMSYYLDQGHILVMTAKGEYPFSEAGESVVIFAVNYSFGMSFMTFTAYSDGTHSASEELTRNQLLDGVKGVPKFYISKEIYF